jgi:hypothetical protein
MTDRAPGLVTVVFTDLVGSTEAAPRASSSCSTRSSPANRRPGAPEPSFTISGTFKHL